MRGDQIAIDVRTPLLPKDLAAFYERNRICPAGQGADRAGHALRHTDLLVTAWRQDELVGLARALFDGFLGVISEFCVALDCQGPDATDGSVITGDSLGVGRAVGEAVVRELLALGATRISVHPHDAQEEAFYRTLGFHRTETTLTLP